MAYTPTDAAPTDLEARMGLESLEALHFERRALIKKIAPLELLFGSGGDRWTAKRRQHRDTTAKQLLAELAPAEGDWKRPSDAALERMANADPRHTAFVEETEARFPDYMVLKTALTEIEELIASREYTSRYITKELGLQA